jgi:hypothetical protein
MARMTPTPPMTMRTAKATTLAILDGGAHSTASKDRTQALARQIFTVKRKLTAAILLALLSPLAASAQGTLAVPPVWIVQDTNGDPIASAKVYVYLAGTETDVTAYQEYTLTTPHAQPVVADSAGRVTIFLTAGVSYKYVVKDASSVTLYTVDGVTQLTGRGQISFPSSQIASSGANVLDDYEEGTWTPAIGGSGGQSGQAYTTQVGRYVKIGKLVTCTFQVTLSTLGTITTNVQVQGLPFTSENTTGQRVPVQIGYWSGLTSTYVFIGGFLEPNATVVTLQGATAAATGLSVLAQANLAATSQFIGSISYVASQ